METKKNIFPSIFRDYFTDRAECGHYLRPVSNNNLTVPIKNTTRYGIKSITYQCITTWNEIPSNLKVDPLLINSFYLFKKAIFYHYHDQYAYN